MELVTAQPARGAAGSAAGESAQAIFAESRIAGQLKIINRFMG
jgi:hypothetical protein